MRLIIALAILLYFSDSLILKSCSTLSFVPVYNRSLASPHISEIKGEITRRLYKLIRRRIEQSTETPEKRKERIEKEDRSKRDGLLYGPKTNYKIYIALDNRPPDEIKTRFRHIFKKLIAAGAEHANVYYCGLKKLVRPIKKRYEARFIVLELAIYPSLIDHIRLRLLDEPTVLRVLVLRDKYLDKERRIYRDKNLHARHPYFDTKVYAPLKSRLIQEIKDD